MKHFTAIAALLIFSLLTAVGTGACGPIPGADTADPVTETAAPLPAVVTGAAVTTADAQDEVAARALDAPTAAGVTETAGATESLAQEAETATPPGASAADAQPAEAVTGAAEAEGAKGEDADKDAAADKDRKAEEKAAAEKEAKEKAAKEKADKKKADKKKAAKEKADKEKADKKKAAKEKAKKEKAEKAKKKTVTLSIDCLTILDNMDKLTPGKEKLVGNGWIMKEKKVELKDGDTAFDLLVRECKAAKIHMEHSYVPMYESAYIEGINNLYEFDAGELSGWMYSVNGWYPNYGCSKYELKDGDVMKWRYTCDLGRDVGGEGAVTG
jgi:hypothetical protein